MFYDLIPNIIQCVKNLGNMWIVKAIISIFITAVCSIHARLLSIFVVLVMLDLLSKWIALAHEYKKDNAHISVSLWQSILSIPKARKAGYIKSDVMKRRFIAKISIYIIVVLGACLVDYSMVTLNKPTILVELVVTYLTLTEFISILENLQQADVEEVSLLENLIKKIQSKK